MDVDLEEPQLFLEEEEVKDGNDQS